MIPKETILKTIEYLEERRHDVYCVIGEISCGLVLIHRSQHIKDYAMKMMENKEKELDELIEFYNEMLKNKLKED